MINQFLKYCIILFLLLPFTFFNVSAENNISNKYKEKIQTIMNNFFITTEKKDTTNKEKIEKYENLHKKINKNIWTEKNPTKIQLYTFILDILDKKIQEIKWEIEWENDDDLINDIQEEVNLSLIKEKISTTNSEKQVWVWYCTLKKISSYPFEITKLSTKLIDFYKNTDSENCARMCREVISWKERYSCSVSNENPKFDFGLNLGFEKQNLKNISIEPIKNIKNKDMFFIWIYEWTWNEWQWINWTPWIVHVKVSKNLWVLVLSAYDKTEWILDIVSWVTIDHIITNWYYNQIVKWNNNIPVTQISVENGNVFNASSDDKKTDWFWVINSEKPDCSTYMQSIYEQLNPIELKEKWPGYIPKKIWEKEVTSCQKDFYPLAKEKLKRITWLEINWFAWEYTWDSFEVK